MDKNDTSFSIIEPETHSSVASYYISKQFSMGGLTATLKKNALYGTIYPALVKKALSLEAVRTCIGNVPASALFFSEIR